jgi:hypothetical protein
MLEFPVAADKRLATPGLHMPVTYVDKGDYVNRCAGKGSRGDVEWRISLLELVNREPPRKRGLAEHRSRYAR